MELLILLVIALGFAASIGFEFIKGWLDAGREDSRPAKASGISDKDWDFALATSRGLHADTIPLVYKFLSGKLDGWDFADSVTALPGPDVNEPTNKDRELALAILKAKYRGPTRSAPLIFLGSGDEVRAIQDTTERQS